MATGDLKKLTDVTQVARFEIEARLLSFLSHPRVVRVLDHFNDPSGYFLVMELVRGADLGQVLKAAGNPGLPVDVVLNYTHQTCEALDYVHDQRIVHRDVKPENLILGERGVCARAWSRGDGSLSRARAARNLTRRPG